MRDALPPDGLFADRHWRISPSPFALEPALAKELDGLGRVLLQFNRAVNLLYRQSVAGKQPAWVAGLLDQGKPPELIELQRAPELKNELPRVIRPDILLTESGFSITELDSVPGGIGLTAWLNQTYSALMGSGPGDLARSAMAHAPSSPRIVGGAEGMLKGFESIFGDAARVHVIVSEESATYRPEMEWVAAKLGPRFVVQDSTFADFAAGDAVYRFFELFDLAHVPSASRLFEMALRKEIRLTPPPKPVFEEKLLFALLWNRNLREFWRRELGEA
ncbi:MAG: hypothetical protein NTW03_19730, partial [Verrucomicrobia bacterium]|nr:hypothetical protein [Verrucomicrobiota bacterium]